MYINVIRINQDLTGGVNQNKIFYLGKIKFSQLKNIVELNSREYDPNGNATGIQRYYRDIRKYADITKLQQIKDFVSDIKLDIPYFTSPIIFGFSSDDGGKLEMNDDQVNGKIIFDPDFTGGLIVDGQHRYYGMLQRWEEDNSFDIELGIVFLIDYDKYQLSKVFANINFTQKPVNKSLFYDLFGSIPGEFNDLNLVHLLVKELNFNQNSPLFRQIKMLGSGDGFISQAFMIEKLHKYFLNIDVIDLSSKRKVLDDYSTRADEMKILYKDKLEREAKLQELTEKFKGEPLFSSIFQLLSFYFQFINEKFSNVSNVKNTIGYGAFIRLLKDFIENSEGFFENYVSILESNFLPKIELIKSKLEEVKGSSESAQNNLYKDISFILFDRQINSAKDAIIAYFKDKVGNQVRLIDLYTEILPVLERNYPYNNNLPAKIRQIIQILRDEGVVEFIGSGTYKVLKI